MYHVRKLLTTEFRNKIKRYVFNEKKIFLLSYLYVIGRDEEASPADDHEEAAGDVVGDDVVADLALHHHPEAGHRVVPGLLRKVVALVRQQRLDLDLEQKNVAVCKNMRVRVISG